MRLLNLMKTRLFSTLCALALLASPALAAGTLPLAMAQQVDINGQPVLCQVNFFVAGTPATLQNSYSDFSLTQQQPNPLACDQTGRVPMFWLADGLVHVRMIDGGGLTLVDTTMQVLGPSSGGGGGGSTVDPTALLATGDVKLRYGTGPLAGFVRANNLTIGNATCGCTERANADTQSLFVYLYNSDSNLVVSGGRSGNALNDFNASKQLTLPDYRGRVPAGLGDMGNTDAARLTAAGFGSAATTLGVAGGNEIQTLTLAQLPGGITSAGSNSVNVSSSGFIPALAAWTGFNAGALSSGSFYMPYSTNNTGASFINSMSGTVSISSTSNNTGGLSHPNVQPTMLQTFYIKM